MNRRQGWIAIAGLGAFFAVHLSGCSLIGLGIGTNMDAKKPRFLRVRVQELARVAPGSRVSILLDDSTRVVGIYRGAIRIADDEYRATYDGWRAHHPRGASFPRIGEHVEVEPGGKGAFQGFVADGIEVRNRRWGSDTYPYEGWLSRDDGVPLDLFDVRELAWAGDLPLATALRIETDQGEERIAADLVAQIDAPTVRHAARTGFLVGLAADVLIVAMVRGADTGTTGCTYDGPTDWGPILYSRGSRPMPMPAP